MIMDIGDTLWTKRYVMVDKRPRHKYQYMELFIFFNIYINGF